MKVYSGFVFARLAFLLVSLASLGHSSSGIDTQPVGPAQPSSWLETLILDGGPQEVVVGVAGDQDYFRIDVAGPTWRAIYTSGPVDIAGQLYDPDGREVPEDDGGGDEDNFRIETIRSRSGTYYLLVEPSDGAGGSIGPPATEFDLAPDNVDPSGIEFGNGRLHVVDSTDKKVYVYDVSGRVDCQGSPCLTRPLLAATGVPRWSNPSAHLKSVQPPRRHS